MKIAKHTFIALFVLASALPFVTHAIVETQQQTQEQNRNQGGQNQLQQPDGPGTSADKPLITCGTDQNPCDADDFNALIQNVLRLAFIFGGFIVAAMFMYAGFMLITSAGDMGKIQRAKDIFRRVVIGFLIMSLSYLLVENLLTNIKAQDFFKNIFK